MTDSVVNQQEHILNVPSQETAAPTIAKVDPRADQQPSLDEALLHLEQLSLEALQDRWRKIYGQRVPGRLGAEFLRRALAYRLQETALGGLSRQAQLRLKAWSPRSQSGGDPVKSLQVPVSIKPGTRFVREWQAETHEVLAIEDDNFVYQGKSYRSLTVIAREITGTHQSGPRFFGLRGHCNRIQIPEQSHG